jgi:hypothetical protein
LDKNDKKEKRIIIMADNNNNNNEEGYSTFRARTAKGVLFRLSPLDDPLRERLTKYVEEGAMDADHRYVRTVYGLVNTSSRKDFDQYWESPWMEEHALDTTRKRKLDAAQRSLAVRSFIRASTTTAPDPENVDRFLHTVDKLTEWEDRHGARDLVKTVSRLVQSFEHVAISTMRLLLDSPAYTMYKAAVNTKLPARTEDVACTLRRHADTYDLFACLVASELIWGEATNGTRNASIYMLRQIEDKRQNAAIALVRSIAQPALRMEADVLGMPLMSVNGSMCVTRGVLVVMPGQVNATYVLDLQEGEAPDDLAHVKTIQIMSVVEEADLPAAQKRNAPRRSSGGASAGGRAAAAQQARGGGRGDG